MSMNAVYDEIAKWYDASIRSGSLVHELVLPALDELIGDVAGQCVCDLACGQGVAARRLARHGASVVGVDVSAKLLAIAQRDEAAEPLGISYRIDDAQTLATVPAASFDGVVCNMALMDIPDLAATFGAVRRVLRPGGWFVFSITHPCFQTPLSDWLEQDGTIIGRTVRGYFAEDWWRSTNPMGVRGQVGSYHRTLTTYVNGLLDAGLRIDRMREPRATGALAALRPGYTEIATALVVRCIDGALQTGSRRAHADVRSCP